MKNYHKVLTIAGSDSSGGAGIQADIKTISSLGCYGMSVITTLTAQNTKGVTGIHLVPPSFVEEQIDAVLSDIGADVVKIGMLYSMEMIETVYRQLSKHKVDKIVLDPVMAAQSGEEFFDDKALNALKVYLMPITLVLTPNLPEAEKILGRHLEGVKSMEDAVKVLAKYGSENILLKGGHMKDSTIIDILYIKEEDRFVEMDEQRIETWNDHGTGCTLSSAIAAFLAKGCDVEDAVRNAKQYITESIKAGIGYKLGQGRGPVHHFFDSWS